MCGEEQVTETGERGQEIMVLDIDSGLLGVLCEGG